MAFDTLKTQSKEGLLQSLQDAQMRLQTLLFKKASHQQVREIRALKKTIARAKTLLQQNVF